MPSLYTERLELLQATPELLRAAIDGDLAAALGAIVPPTWPPEFLDRGALEYTLQRLTAAPNETGWWMYFVILREPRTLIGSGGYKGPPSDSTIEVGYGIVRDRRRQGYASEVVRGLLVRAFAHPGVSRAIAETFPELIGSIGVLRKCGFREIGAGSEPGVVRFELSGG
jgi:ribosomal-protein-alanine N-acetyltransferase